MKNLKYNSNKNYIVNQNFFSTFVSNEIRYLIVLILTILKLKNFFLQFYLK